MGVLSSTLPFSLCVHPDPAGPPNDPKMVNTRVFKPPSSATVMLQNPGQARGARQQGGGPRIKSLWPEWRKDTLFGGSQWEALSLMHTTAWQA
eukprot:1161301-Pelagomonas_calceolata.AAC.20